MTFTRRSALSGERTEPAFADVHPHANKNMRMRMERTERTFANAHPDGSEGRDALRFTVESLREGFGR